MLAILFELVIVVGEARSKNYTRNERLRDKLCVFCGGDKPAVQLDHVPAKILFANKLRPKGLEFPACPDCNQGTKDYDQIIGLLSRLTLSGGDQYETKDLDKLVRAFRTNYPNVINELDFHRLGSVTRKKTKRQYPEASDTALITGPIIGSVISKFGAKLGFALHYLSTGRIVPHDGAAAIWLITNEALVSGEFPVELVKLFPEYQSLNQGKLSVVNQFGYSSIVLNDIGATAHIAYFRLSFFLIIYVFEKDAIISAEKILYDPSELQRPGDWKIQHQLR